MLKLKIKQLQLLISFIFALLLFIFSMDFGMFWDNVLFASKMGNHLYENGIFSWNIPNTYDPGHPPFLGFILAFFWKLFGHSLWVSHMTMMPFVIGTIYQLYRCVFYYTQNQTQSFFAFVLLLADPTLATSLVLVNPEVIILFFFFLVLNGFLYKESLWKFVGLFFLSIITFRSMMLFAGFFLFEVLNQLYINKKSLKQLLNLKFLVFYCLSSLPAALYISWRLIAKGWLQTHINSPWADYWLFPSFPQFLKNFTVLVHRYIDFGRVFIFIFLLIILLKFRRKIRQKKSYKQILLLSICSVTFVVFAVLFSRNAFGHRYFIVSYILFTLLAFLLLNLIKKWKKIIFTLLFFGLITGNLWIYPERISQGWDSTLAHVPYHKLRLDAIDYLNEQNIDIENVASFFPNYNKVDEIDLSGNQKAFQKFNEMNEYVFYSNVYNLSDKEYQTLENNFIEVKRFQKFQIYITILKNMKSF